MGLYCSGQRKVSEAFKFTDDDEVNTSLRNFGCFFFKEYKFAAASTLQLEGSDSSLQTDYVGTM